MSCERRMLIAAALVAGCGGKGGAATTPTPPTVVTVPATTIKVGDCGAPDHDGVVSAAPRLVRDAERDLDGDGRAEVVVADRALCTPEGNCYWNVFALPDDGGCARFWGTLAGAKLDASPPTAAGVPGPIRSYWSLGGPRLLIQTYAFRHGGYALVDTLVCRREDDDRLACTEDLR